ncbi:MAG: CoA transferase [Ignavibacteriales bacterium]|nr:CoA transferase [Ignavibacteriales bacterium]
MKIFKGLRVLELSSVLAGPSVGMFFAELGADVIKIENPLTNGDVTRSWKLSNENIESDISSYFCSVNWGKKSIALNLEEKEDYNIFSKLVKISDVITVSFKFGDDKKLKADYKSIKKINSKIIYAQITGFGIDDERTAFDAVIQAYSGFMFMNGLPLTDPLKMPVALIDILAAHQIKEAVLLAYIEKLKSGKGSFVECSLLQAGISSLANQASNYLNASIIPERKGSDHPNIFPYGTTFLTKDKKHILLAIGNDKQFKTFCNLIDKKEEINCQKFSTNLERVKNRDELKEILSNIILKYNSKSLIELLNRKKIPAAVIKNMKEVFEQNQAKEILLTGIKDNKRLFGVNTFSANIKNQRVKTLSPPPHLDENRKEIFNLIK